MGQGCDAGGRVHGNAADLVLDHLAFAGVQAGADAYPERENSVGDAASAAYAPRRTVKGGQHAVACRAHLHAAKTWQLATDDAVEAFQQIAPALVAQFRCPSRGADDVGEENSSENSIWLGSVALPRKELLDLVEDRVGVGPPRQM